MANRRSAAAAASSDHKENMTERFKIESELKAIGPQVDAAKQRLDQQTAAFGKFKNDHADVYSQWKENRRNYAEYQRQLDHAKDILKREQWAISGASAGIWYKDESEAINAMAALNAASCYVVVFALQRNISAASREYEDLLAKADRLELQRKEAELFEKLGLDVVKAMLMEFKDAIEIRVRQAIAKLPADHALFKRYNGDVAGRLMNESANFINTIRKDLPANAPVDLSKIRTLNTLLYYLDINTQMTPNERVKMVRKTLLENEEFLSKGEAEKTLVAGVATLFGQRAPKAADIISQVVVLVNRADTMMQFGAAAPSAHKAGKKSAS